VAVVVDPGSPSEASVTPARGEGHYFTDDPSARSRPRSVRLVLPDLTIDLATDAGTFSPDRVDPGTKLLLGELPGRLPGPVLDLGCGYGPIACTVAARDPEAEVWAIDVNRRARELCERNAAELGLRVHVAAPQDVLDDLRFGCVVSNPPIRIGKAALHELLEHWLGRLTDGGEAWLVVNRHLGADSLAAWLRSQGHEVERVRSRQGYRILRVRPA